MAAVALTAAALKEALKEALEEALEGALEGALEEALEGALEGALEVVSCSGRVHIFVDCLRLFADCSLAMTKWNEDSYV